MTRSGSDNAFFLMFSGDLEGKSPRCQNLSGCIETPGMTYTLFEILLFAECAIKAGGNGRKQVGENRSGPGYDFQLGWHTG